MGGGGAIPRDKLGSPSTGSEDGGGGIDLADLVPELDQDDFDGPTTLNGMSTFVLFLKIHTHYFIKYRTRT